MSTRACRALKRLCCPALGVYLASMLLSAHADVIYVNDFHEAPGTNYDEWTSSGIKFLSAADPPGAGTLPAAVVTNSESPNHARRFLGEFGGPPIGRPGDPGYNRTRVEQTIRLALHNLPPHAGLKITFDLLILKSWDGNNPRYGPDRWRVSVSGATLLDTTFSNNPKVEQEGCTQDYPKPGSPPHSGAASIDTLGYSNFFKDSIYRMEFTIRHTGGAVQFDFQSSLFEGKGTDDESWGLGNVRVESVP